MRYGSHVATIIPDRLVRLADQDRLPFVPITYTLDREARLVRAAVRGDFTADDMLACVSAAALDAGEAGYNVVSDHREIGEPATRSQVVTLVEHLATLRRYFAGARWAVIVSKPASFGMMRMLGTMAERVPMEVHVFKDAEQAERWARSGTELAPG
jgi:hypothetical protein